MQYIGESAALGAAFLWTFSSFVFTYITTKISTLMLNIIRLFISAILLLLTIYVFGVNYHVTQAQFWFLSLSGFVGLVLGDTFLFRAFKEIGPRVTMLLMSSNPAMAAILAYFFLGEVLSIWGIIGMIITLAGISIVVMDSRGNKQAKFHLTRIGVFYGFMAAVGQAVGLIFGKLAFNEGDVHWTVATFIRIAAAAVVMLPLVAAVGRFNNPIKPFKEDKKLFGWVFLGSIIGPYLGISFSFIAIIYTKVGIASTLMSTVPILMLPLSRMIHKEKLSWSAIAGAFIAVFGVAILFLR